LEEELIQFQLEFNKVVSEEDLEEDIQSEEDLEEDTRFREGIQLADSNNSSHMLDMDKTMEYLISHSSLNNNLVVK
jgi:hypothetical protein